MKNKSNNEYKEYKMLGTKLGTKSELSKSVLEKFKGVSIHSWLL